MAALDAVFNEAAFNESFANSPKNEYGVNVDKMTNPGSLASKTNVKAGLDVAADILLLIIILMLSQLYFSLMVLQTDLILPLQQNL